MSESLPFFDAADVHRALDYPRLIDVLREAFREGANVPPRHVHAVAPRRHGRLLLMPAWRENQAIGVKLVSVFPENRAHGVATVSALYVLLDGKTGHPVALLDGEALTLRRTGAASALASSYLSRADSKTLVLVGTGRLAPYMAAAHRIVRPIERVLVWGRSFERARALAAQLTTGGITALARVELACALAEADIVSCATTSREPIVLAQDVRPGTHIDLVGGFTQEMREADDALIARSEVFVDTFAGALKEAGDLIQPIASGVIDPSHVRAELADLVHGRHAGRGARDSVTLFKSVGSALEDLAAAQLVVEAANPRR